MITLKEQLSVISCEFVELFDLSDNKIASGYVSFGDRFIPTQFDAYLNKKVLDVSMQDGLCLEIAIEV